MEKFIEVINKYAGISFMVAIFGTQALCEFIIKILGL